MQPQGKRHRHGFQLAGGDFRLEVVEVEALRARRAAAGLEFPSRQGLNLQVAGHQAAVIVDHVGPGVEIRDPRVAQPRRGRVRPKLEDGRQRFLERHGVEHLESVV